MRHRPGDELKESTHGLKFKENPEETCSTGLVLPRDLDDMRSAVREIFDFVPMEEIVGDLL